MPPDPLGAHPFSTHLIEKISQFYILKTEVGQYAGDSLGTISTVGEEHGVISQTAAGNRA